MVFKTLPVSTSKTYIKKKFEDYGGLLPTAFISAPVIQMPKAFLNRSVHVIVSIAVHSFASIHCLKYLNFL